jgi:hypothetical protein
MRSPTLSRALAWAPLPIVVLVVAKLALHLAANGGYGFLRDELAYIDDGKHLAFGYIDHPPLAPWLAAFARTLFPDDAVLGLRLFPALASTGLLALTMLMAREMGGGRWAVLIAGLAFLGAPIFLATGVLFQAVSFDLLLWGAFTYCFVRMARTGETRWWWAMGAAAGLGLLAKYTTAFYLVGFSVALLALPQRDLVRSRDAWIGIAIAVLIALPNVLWQAANDFIALDYTDAINERDRNLGRTDSFLPDQFLLLGPPGVVVWVTGLVALLRRPARPELRVLGVAFVLTVALFAVSQGRGYYTAAVYPPLFAAGAVAIGGARAEWLRFARPALAALLAAGAVFSASVSMPIAPPGSGYFDFASDLNEDLPEMVGWPELVATIADVRDGLPADEQDDVAILAGNYGEAGAINLYGGRYGLPEAISPVNTYHRWSEGRLDASVYIVVGVRADDLATIFARCEQAAVVTNNHDVENEETRNRDGVQVCRDPHRPLEEVWDQLQRFS